MREYDNKKIEKIMQQVDIQGIPMKNMELFKNSLTDDKNKCEAIETIEVKELYKSWLDIGEIVVDLYSEAKHKYIKTINDMKENYMVSEIQCEKRGNQNNELKKDIKKRNNELRKINDIDERMRIFHEISNYKKVIKLNESSMKFSQDFSRAEIMATFDIFNDLSKSVDAVYSKNEYIDNKAIIGNLKDVILMMVSKINPVAELVIDGADILKAAVKTLNATDAGKQMNNSINSIDKGIKQLKERRINMLVALLAIKVYIDELDELIQKISTRNAQFSEMALDEKLKEIGNLIEYLLKKDGKFITLNYDYISLGFIRENDVKELRKKIQCFRHSSQESLKERKEYTENQKQFMVGLGIIMCNLIYNELKNN